MPKRLFKGESAGLDVPRPLMLWRNSGLDFVVSEWLLTRMTSPRLTSDLRRQLILTAARRCFALHGYAGTTTRSVAAAAGISEALLFKHFSSKAVLYAEILAEECEATPALIDLLECPPSTATLVQLICGMVRHFIQIVGRTEVEEAQRLRLLASSQLDDGELARHLYAKVEKMIGHIFTASLERAVAAGDAREPGCDPFNLFWFAHHTVMMATLTGLSATPCLGYGNDPRALERQLCEFLLRGIGVHDAAIAAHLATAAEPVAAD